MNRAAAEAIADAILYEGYMLYPYRPSAIKNRQRWMFGTLYPPGYDEVVQGSERNGMHSECLLVGDEKTSVHVQLRFLHLVARQLKDATGAYVRSMQVGTRTVESWDEGVARSLEFDVANVAQPRAGTAFSFSESVRNETVEDDRGKVIGNVIRSQHEVHGTITFSGVRVADDVFRFVIDVANETSFAGAPLDRNEALLRSMLSAHLLLSAEHGEFVSLLEPPDQLREIAGASKNVGNFPVLLGDEGAHDMVLCSPILLYDYPRVAPESAGDFFDSTEMDEMLTLRVMTLTDDEKNLMRAGDDRVRALLERTEETARQQLMRTHGTIRDMRPAGEE